MVNVTQYEIAVRVGMSQNSVSEILRCKGKYRRETRQKVLQASEKLGYRPNSFARAMRRGALGAYALLLPAREDLTSIPNALLRGILRELHRHGLHLMVAQLPDDCLDDPDRAPHLLRELLVDGLIIYYCENVPSGMSAVIDRANIPAIWLNVHADTDSIGFNDRKAGFDATQHLLDLGHRRIAFAHQYDFASLNAPHLHHSVRDRYSGYCDAMAKTNAETTYIRSHPDTDGGVSRDILRRQLRAADVTAVVAYEIWNVIAIVPAAERAGLRVPEDLSIVTFHQSPFTELGLDVTLVQLPFERMGEMAVEMMQRRTNGHTNAPERVVLNGMLHPGASCQSVSPGVAQA